MFLKSAFSPNADFLLWRFFFPLHSQSFHRHEASFNLHRCLCTAAYLTVYGFPLRFKQHTVSAAIL
jgi:hypothetical protein